MTTVDAILRVLNAPTTAPLYAVHETERCELWRSNGRLACHGANGHVVAAPLAGAWSLHEVPLAQVAS